MSEPTTGTRDNPYTVSPADWDENGVPYGAFCKCCYCGLVERSTFVFDYYANESGELLRCETCAIGASWRAAKPVLDLMEKEGDFDELA